MSRATSHPGEDTALGQQSIVGQQPQAIDAFNALLELDQIVVQTGMVGTRQYEDQANGRGVLHGIGAHSSSPDAP